MTSTTIGVDIGGTGIKAAIVDTDKGIASGRERLETPQPATIDAVAATVGELLERFDVGGPIGCTMPAVVTDGVVRTAAHIDPEWIGKDAAQIFASAIDRQFVVMNDADAAGVAEAHFGVARDHKLVVMVTVGTGIGTALLVDGKLVPNSELGHLEVEGHIADTWVSDATRADKAVPWKRWAARLDRYLQTLHALLWPDLIVIGGGIVKHADKFVSRLDPGCEVQIAQLGNLAGIVGAAVTAAESTAALSTDRS